MTPSSVFQFHFVLKCAFFTSFTFFCFFSSKYLYFLFHDAVTPLCSFAIAFNDFLPLNSPTHTLRMYFMLIRLWFYNRPLFVCIFQNIWKYCSFKDTATLCSFLHLSPSCLLKLLSVFPCFFFCTVLKC